MYLRVDGSVVSEVVEGGGESALCCQETGVLSQVLRHCSAAAALLSNDKDDLN